MVNLELIFYDGCQKADQQIQKSPGGEFPRPPMEGDLYKVL